jgi:superoxide dismutase, Cu-Zn family
MQMSRKTVVAAIVVAGCLGSGGAALAAAGSSSRSAGPEYVYGGTGELGDATAEVHMVTTGDGSSLVTLHVRGAEAVAGRTFGAHVHKAACGPVPTDAQGHYQHAATGDLEAREVWLDFTVNAAGNGHAEARRPWSVDQSSPRSVIIHAAPTAADGSAGARLACIDLDGLS